MDELKNILLIAHRGASKLAPQNTIKSFQKAIDLKADYIEFDVRATKDGEIVVIHNKTTNKTANFNGKIKKMTLKELKQLNFGEGEKIPTLRELIEIAKGNIELQCEIKIRGITKKVIEILREEDVIEHTLISSFKHDILKEIKQIEPAIKIGALEPSRTGWVTDWISKKCMIQNAIKNRFEFIHPHHWLLSHKFITYAHEKNLKINAWTVDSMGIMQKLIAKGVDGILTNDVETAKKALNRK